MSVWSSELNSLGWQGRSKDVEVNDLREDVEVAFSRLEAGTDIPLITSYDSTQGFSNDGNSTLVALEGINFLAGRDQASLTLNSLADGIARHILDLGMALRLGGTVDDDASFIAAVWVPQDS